MSYVIVTVADSACPPSAWINKPVKTKAAMDYTVFKVYKNAALIFNTVPEA